jgi:dTDP-4-dehydrorhamnose reductase
MNVLVTGATGMLGREVVKAAVNATGHVCAISHADLDITDKDAVRFTLEALRPDYDVVINCAGLTKHVGGFPDDYRRANTLGPLLLARECDRIGARLIHVSTDCVFSGDRPIEDGPYTEADTPDATDIYGASKAAGEVVAAPHLTVRCSFVGNGERGLIADIAKVAEPVLWWQAWWSGSTAPAIARALVALAQTPKVTGLMHLTNGHVINKALLINGIWKAGVIPTPERWTGSPSPFVNRWLASDRDDVPALPPLADALRELAG